MIVVLGGTGRLGSAVVQRLHAAGEPVAVASRRTGVDLRRPATLAPVLAGADVVVSAAHGLLTNPAEVDANGNAHLIAAAKQAGVSHFVLLSVYGASATHPMELMRAKHCAEVALRQSGLPYAIIRPTSFLELWQELVATVPIVGSGQNPINFVPVGDVATLACELALEQRTGEHDIGGPENLSLNELAARERVTPKHVPRLAARIGGQAMRPFKPGLARLMRQGVWMDTADLTYPH